jgi:hypothetical protein
MEHLEYDYARTFARNLERHRSLDPSFDPRQAGKDAPSRGRAVLLAALAAGGLAVAGIAAFAIARKFRNEHKHRRRTP